MSSEYHLKSIVLLLAVAFCVINMTVAQTESMSMTSTTADEDTTVTG